MYLLYGTNGSGSAAIEAALTLCEAPFERIEAASWLNNPQRDALLQLNPLMQVPTLQLPDGEVMSESAAILIELGLRHPESGLLPAAPAARARVLRGLLFVAANCYAAIGVADFPERWIAPAEAAPPAMETQDSELLGTEAVGALSADSALTAESSESSDSDLSALSSESSLSAESTALAHRQLAKQVKAGAKLRLHWLWEVYADTFGQTLLGEAQPDALDLLATVVSKWSGSRQHLANTRPALLERFHAVERHPRLATIFSRHWPLHEAEADWLPPTVG